MTQVEFSYNGVSTIVQCNLNEKMKDIFQKFKDKAQVGNKNIFYSKSLSSIFFGISSFNSIKAKHSSFVLIKS